MDSSYSTNHNDNKDRTSSYAERNGILTTIKSLTILIIANLMLMGSLKRYRMKESVPSPDNMKPAEGTEANTDSGNSIG